MGGWRKGEVVCQPMGKTHLWHGEGGRCSRGTRNPGSWEWWHLSWQKAKKWHIQGTQRKRTRDVAMESSSPQHTGALFLDLRMDGRVAKYGTTTTKKLLGFTAQKTIDCRLQSLQVILSFIRCPWGVWAEKSLKGSAFSRVYINMVGIVRNLRTTTWRTQQRNGLSLRFPEEVTSELGSGGSYW